MKKNEEKAIELTNEEYKEIKEDKNGANKTARMFTCSLKWDKDGTSWTDKERIIQLLNETRGDIQIFSIIHKQEDTKEAHTHFLIMYKTPRKIKTIANLLNVDCNMIKLVKSKRGTLRYLIHLDNPEKELYTEDKVLYNTKKSYHDYICCEEVTDCEIFKMIEEYGIQHTIKSCIDMGLESNKIFNVIKLYQVYEKLETREERQKEIERLKTENERLKTHLNKKIEDKNWFTK